MAKHYIDNLSEETRKGMLEKARSGIYPSYAPIGYRNTDGPGGKRIIVPDGETAPVLQELYARFAPGTLSLEALVAQRPRESRCGAGRWARVWRIKSCASGCTWANSIGTG
jgi:DNA invertase Pin-like site-specific DNA recombinase